MLSDDICDGGPIVRVPSHEIGDHDGAGAFGFIRKQISGEVRDFLCPRARREHLACTSAKPLLTDTKFAADRKNQLVRWVASAVFYVRDSCTSNTDFSAKSFKSHILYFAKFFYTFVQGITPLQKHVTTINGASQ